MLVMLIVSAIAVVVYLAQRKFSKPKDKSDHVPFLFY